MKSRLVGSALFNLRNFAVLLISMGVAYTVGTWVPGAELIAYSSGVGVYLVFVLTSLFSSKFHEEFNRNQKLRQIKDLNYTCVKLLSQAKKYTNSTYLQKLRKTCVDKDDIVNSFLTGEHSYLKEKIVEQTLILVVAYIKLLTNFCIRSRELSEVDLGTITNRINTNIRKLNFTKDAHAAEDIKNVIDMDERIITRMKDEKNELERISAKLEYMESTVNMFKHQIISHIESEDMLDKLGTAVNEATALDNVLDERRRNRIRG